MTTPSPYIHVKLDVAKGGVRLKSADIVRASPDLAIVNVEVAGKSKGLRFDVGKQAFFDSLGNRKLDEAVDDLKKPLTLKIASAKRKSASSPQQHAETRRLGLSRSKKARSKAER